MADKLAVPTATAVSDSEAATIVANSVIGDDKGSNSGEPSDIETAPSNRIPTPAADPEKKDELTRQATAVSKTGQSIKPTKTREDGEEYPTGVKLGLITLALCLSVFLMALGRQTVPAHWSRANRG